MIIKLADLNIKTDNKYKYISDMCADYITEESDFDIDATVTADEISAEDNGGFSPGYLESLAVYRKIAECLPKYSGFLMHGAVIKYKNCGIAFLAKSGVGKSTHLSLWQSLFEDKVSVINGDKPIIRITDGIVYAYGTPWAGKEHMHTNTKTTLKKICFIERASENKCVKIKKSEAIIRFLSQIYIPKNGDMPEIFGLLETLTAYSDFYIIRCTEDISAAKTAYETIMNDNSVSNKVVIH